MKISLITVVYNNEKTIERCIKSVIDQDYKDIEYIIIDGDSSDNTMSIINKYQNKIDLVVSEKDAGLYDAMNKGYLLATGDVIGILNSDDYFFDNCSLSYIADTFKKSEVDSCYGNLNYVDESGKVIRYWNSGNISLSKFKKSWIPPHPTFYIKRTLVEKYGLYDLSFNLAADYDYMLRLLFINKISTAYVDRVLVNMSLGGVTNKNFQNVIIQNRQIYNSWKKYSQNLNIIVYMLNKVFIRFLQRIGKTG